MSYIGQTLPADTFQGFTTDSFAGDGSATTFTLSKTPFNESALLVVINNVVQKPTTNFTVSGTTLTIVGTAVASGDVIYATHIGGALPIGQAASLDLNGASDQLILDADADTTISADTDDQIDIKVAGTDALRVTGTALTGNAVATIGATGTASSLAGIPFYNGDGNNSSIYTHDVSGTDSTAQYNTAYGLTAMDAITTGDNNVALGWGAGTALTTGSNNIAIGVTALQVEDTGTQNIAIGTSALSALNYDSDGNNVCIGFEAGESITSGRWNHFIGTQAGDDFDTEHSNLGIGYRALGGSIAGGEYNVSIGNSSGMAVTSGDANHFFGYYAGSSATTGSNNTAVGYYCLQQLTEGSHNTGLGKNVYEDLTTGNYNTGIGAEVEVSAAGATHQITLGYGIGSNGDSNFTFGQAGNRVYNNFTSNASWTRSSDERKKQNIKDDSLGLDFINKLRTVTYQWRPSNEFPKEWDEYNEENQMDTEVVMHGLIAQEVKSALDNAGVDTFGGWTENKDGMQNISREMFVFPLIKAVQELSAKVKELENK